MNYRARLDILSQKYKLKELDYELKEAFEKGDIEAVELVRKVMSCYVIASENNQCIWQRISKGRDEDNQPIRLFSDVDILILNQVGSFGFVVEYAQRHKLLEEVKRVMKQKIRKNRVKELRGVGVANDEVHRNVSALVKQKVKKF